MEVDKTTFINGHQKHNNWVMNSMLPCRTQLSREPNYLPTQSLHRLGLHLDVFFQ